MKRLLITGFLFGAAVFSLLSCQKELSVESNSNLASFSLLSDSSKCLFEPEVNGNYYNGVTSALSGNFVKVVVNVKTTGDYTLSTVIDSTSNGFSFSASGFFSKIGLDTIILQPHGKPILIGLTDFTFDTKDGGCPFSVDVEDSTGTGLGGVDTSGSGTTNGGSASYVDPKPASNDTWHFTDGTNNKTYSGKMVSTTLQSNSGLNVLSGTGQQSSNSKEIFSFIINLPSATIATGSYPADFVTSFITLSNTSTSTFDYTTDGSTPNEAADPSYINITSYDASTKRLAISFRCWAVDASGKPALIEGSLNAKVQ